MKGRSMKRSRLLLATSTVLATFALSAAAYAATATAAWARPGNDDVAVYFTLTNNTNKAITLVGAASPVAKSTELHRSSPVEANAGDMEMSGMTMQTVQSLTVEPHQHINFEPGGYHVMLIHMRHSLKLGQHFPLVLIFRNKTREIVPVSVINR